MQHERNPGDAAIAAWREMLAGADRALAVPRLPDPHRATLLKLRYAAAEMARRRLLAEIRATGDEQTAAFVRTWEAVARACEQGLADPAYPDERRAGLYDLLGAARECAEPAELERIRNGDPAARRFNTQALVEKLAREEHAVYGADGIGHLELRHGVLSPLRDAGVYTIAEVRRRLAADSVRWVWGLGPKRIAELREALERYDARVSR